MSISNTVSKVEEFEYDNASETTIDNELEKSSSTTEGKTAVRVPKAKQLSVKSLTRAVKA